MSPTGVPTGRAMIARPQSLRGELAPPVDGVEYVRDETGRPLLCYVPDLATLAADSAMPESDVAAALAEGEAGGWIQYAGSDGGDGFFYRLTIPQGSEQ